MDYTPIYVQSNNAHITERIKHVAGMKPEKRQRLVRMAIDAIIDESVINMIDTLDDDKELKRRLHALADIIVDNPEDNFGGAFADGYDDIALGEMGSEDLGGGHSGEATAHKIGVRCRAFIDACDIDELPTNMVQFQAFLPAMLKKILGNEPLPK